MLQFNGVLVTGPLTCTSPVLFTTDIFIIFHSYLFFFRDQDMRVSDGIHWNFMAHRRISNLILTHISEAWRQPLPRAWAELCRNRDTLQQNSCQRNHSAVHNPLASFAPPPVYGGGDAPSVGRRGPPRGRHVRSASCDVNSLSTTNGNFMRNFTPPSENHPNFQVADILNSVNSFNFEPYRNSPLQQNIRQHFLSTTFWAFCHSEKWYQKSW